MPELRKATATAVVLLGLLGVGPASGASASASDAAKSAAAEFDAINREIVALWASHPCFRAPNSSTHRSVQKCWAAQPEAAAAAAGKTNDLVDRLETIAASHPSTIVILQSKLNLMTRAGLFCEQAELPQAQVDILSTQAGTFREWTSSLEVCAEQMSDADMHDRLRGALEKNVASFSKATRVALLRLWFNSFVFQYAPNGDLAKLAEAMNAQGVEAWKTFVDFLRNDVDSFPDFPSTSVSRAELLAARSALNAA